MANVPDDDMEYYIKFPASSPKELAGNSENDEFTFVYHEDKLPVIVLLGWAGCQDKYLSKYSAIYEQRGCITLRCTAPVVATFMRHDRLPKLGKKLLDVIYDMTLDEHPIFFHIFSNGGAFFYQHISFHMQRQERKLQVKGVIFDSAPGEKRFYSVYRALSAIIGGSQWYNVPLAFVIALFLFLSFLIMAYIKAFLHMKKPQTDPIVLADEPFNWPQLFIYSKNDELVRFEDVEKFISMREKRGIRVERLCLENSPHVQHLITVREQYITTVLNFVHNCLKRMNT
ncbi:UNVERIFIED_CONTAM: hypothetical protein PYX00_004663 [Menopon gallinae]|uniref:Transmembrane protein 53 n=1 Tax=Menopon gallinae TaxID=328185 RepID=A0AAW2I4K5_9NEOP